MAADNTERHHSEHIGYHHPNRGLAGFCGIIYVTSSYAVALHYHSDLDSSDSVTRLTDYFAPLPGGSGITFALHHPTDTARISHQYTCTVVHLTAISAPRVTFEASVHWALDVASRLPDVGSALSL